MEVDILPTPEKKKKVRIYLECFYFVTYTSLENMEEYDNLSSSPQIPFMVLKDSDPKYVG